MNETMFDIDYTRTLPSSLKNDEKIHALGRVIAAELQNNVRLSRLNIIYARIDELSEDILDVLAYDMHIEWYNDLYTVDIKRQVIKDSVKIHKRKGTKYAVEQAVNNIVPDSKVEEFFEYGGEPYFFRVIINGRINSFEDYDGIINAIFETKNVRSWLEKLIRRFEAEGIIYIGQVARRTKKYEVDALQTTQGIRAANVNVGGLGKQKKKRLICAGMLEQTVNPCAPFISCIGKRIKRFTVSAHHEGQRIAGIAIYAGHVFKSVTRIEISTL